jgi:hypothetical protein
MTRTIVSKSDYARMKGRDKAIVTRWLKRGSISEQALVGKGRNARIWVERADADLAERLNPARQLDRERPAIPVARPIDPGWQQAAGGVEPNPAGDFLVRRNMAQADKAVYDAEAARRKLEVDAGRWVEREAMERTFGRILQRELGNIEQFMTNALPQALESKFGVAWKEISIAIRDEWRDYRGEAAKKLAAEAGR